VALCTNHWSYGHSIGEQYATSLDGGTGAQAVRIPFETFYDRGGVLKMRVFSPTTCAMVGRL
jgi:hypothetical protein